MAESLKNKTVKGTIWSSLERFSVQGIQFIVMVVMARMLTPEDYGLVGMLAIFIAISQSLIDSGFSQALIRKQDRSELDNSTVFYFNIGVGIFLYISLFLCAPLIAEFYNEPILTPITRVIGLSLVFNSLAVVQRALLTIRLDFKTQAKASLVGAIISGGIGIGMAYYGFGVWSIVWQQISNLGIVTILLWILSKWKPIWGYSWNSFKILFNFGSKLLASGLLETLYRNLYLILIGKVFKASDLGYYTRAHQFTDFASSNIGGIIQRVTYPVLCSIQDDDQRLRDVYRKLLKNSTFIVFPLMMGLAAIAHPMILAFLNEKWIFSAVLIQILCFSQMWYPVHSLNLNLLQVKGRSDLFLRLEIIKKIIGISIILVTIPFGLLAMCWGAVVNSIIALAINTYYTGKLIQLHFWRQMADILPTLVLSMSVGAIVYLSISYISISSWILMIIGIIEGILLYVTIAKVFKFQELSELLSIIRKNNNIK